MTNSLGNMCYCYKDDCNQKEWERQGRTGKRQWTVVSKLWINSKLFGKTWPHPVCKYCGEKMTVTANMSDEY